MIYKQTRLSVYPKGALVEPPPRPRCILPSGNPLRLYRRVVVLIVRISSFPYCSQDSQVSAAIMAVQPHGHGSTQSRLNAFLLLCSSVSLSLPGSRQDSCLQRSSLREYSILQPLRQMHELGDAICAFRKECCVHNISITKVMFISHHCICKLPFMPRIISRHSRPFFSYYMCATSLH